MKNEAFKGSWINAKEFAPQKENSKSWWSIAVISGEDFELVRYHYHKRKWYYIQGTKEAKVYQWAYIKPTNIFGPIDSFKRMYEIGKTKKGIKIDSNKKKKLQSVNFRLGEHEFACIRNTQYGMIGAMIMTSGGEWKNLEFEYFKQAFAEKIK